MEKLKIKKQRFEKIVTVTAYDYFTTLVAKSIEPDFILVGDSLGTVIKGEKDTLNVTLNEIIYHAKIVKKHAGDIPVVVDMPFLTYNISKEQALANAGKILVKAGVDGIKIEGFEVLNTIKFLTKNNIPVVGHLGFTPQSFRKLGKVKIYGNDNRDATILLNQAKQLEEAGIFCLILECVKPNIAETIAQELSIPVIGIGAGKNVDGQILVIHDILGMLPGKTPKFVKKYANIYDTAINAIHNYKNEVINGVYPDESHSY